MTVEIISEAIASGARCRKACGETGISCRTYQRWKSGDFTDLRCMAERHIANKLSDGERQRIVDIACSQPYSAMTPHEIVPLLAQEGIYLASERTIYRLLKSRNLLHFRGNSAPRKKSSRPPELAATGPLQVFSWDITYLRTSVHGIYFYAYLFLDIFTRKIIGWEISDRESEKVAVHLMERIGREYSLEGVRLHSDRGNPMKGSTMIMTLYLLGVVPSFSRPRVSDDNPYSEALFRTVKYHRTYPGKFENLQEAREWFAGFIHWYNTEHLHSAIGYVTPEARHNGSAQKIFDVRNAAYAKALQQHPERWSRRATKYWHAPEVVYLNPSDETRACVAKKGAA